MLNPHYRQIAFIAILLCAILLRILLIVYSPTPHGYVYDFYSDAIVASLDNNRLPNAGDCFICYHPPLFPLTGALIFKSVAWFGGDFNMQHYGVGSFTSLLSIIFAIFNYKIYKHFHRQARMIDILVWALSLFMPVIFLTAFSIESDLYVSTLIVISLFYFIKFLENQSISLLVLCGVFAGLSALTKYSGLLVCLAIGLYFFYVFIRHNNRKNFYHGLIFALLCFVFGSYPYLTNLQQYGTPFKGNEAWHTDSYYTDIYSIDTFSISKSVALMKPDAEPGRLQNFEAYNSDVWTSLYGQLWTDMSFFSNKTRHGHKYGNLIYKNKNIPVWMVKMILWLGLLPLLIALIGFINLIKDKRAWPLIFFSVVTILVYVEWVLGFHIWMLKTKYLLHLLPLFWISLGYGATIIKDKYASLAVMPSVFFSLLYGYYFAVS